MLYDYINRIHNATEPEFFTAEDSPIFFGYN